MFPKLELVSVLSYASRTTGLKVFEERTGAWRPGPLPRVMLSTD
jgi:hypothetical protein